MTHLELLELRIREWKRENDGFHKSHYTTSYLGMAIKRYVGYCIMNNAGVVAGVRKLHTEQLIAIIKSNNEMRAQAAAYVIGETAFAYGDSELTDIIEAISTGFLKAVHTDSSRWTKIYNKVSDAIMERENREYEQRDDNESGLDYQAPTFEEPGHDIHGKAGYWQNMDIDF